MRNISATLCALVAAATVSLTSTNTYALLDAGSCERNVTHYVKKGETLWSLAEHYFGDGRKYGRFLSCNYRIKDPNKIREGERVKVPGRSEWALCSDAGPEYSCR